MTKLGQDGTKFHKELGADDAGMTEVLARRSLESDTPSQPGNGHHAHSRTPTGKRKYHPVSHQPTADHVPEKKLMSEALLSTPTSDACKENPLGGGHNNATASCSSAYSVSPSPPLASWLITSGICAGASTVTTDDSSRYSSDERGAKTSSVNSSSEAFSWEENFQCPGKWLAGHRLQYS